MRMTGIAHLTTRSEILAFCQNTFVVIYIVLPTVFSSANVSKTAGEERCFKEMLTDSGLGI